MAVKFRNSSRRSSDCRVRRSAASKTWLAAEPTVREASVMPTMLRDTSVVPRAAWLTLLAMSWVAAPCCSTDAVISTAMSCIPEMVPLMLRMAATACPVVV